MYPFNPLTPGAFCQNRIFWTFWRFSGWIWAKLTPIYSKRHLQHDSMPFFPLASRFTTVLLKHVQKSKFWEPLEISFPPTEVEDRWCQLEQRLRLVTAGYGQHKSQWVKTFTWKKLTCALISSHSRIFTSLSALILCTASWLCSWIFLISSLASSISLCFLSLS